MFARLSRYEGSPVPPEGDLSAHAETIVQQVRGLPGFLGVYWLVDRATGKAVSLTLWEDEETMRASEERADRIRVDTARREGQRIVSVDRYEVGFGHVET
ncbi:YdhR family protein [Streptomyces sp. PKU-MA01144]|uniref:antibiotic biosynthesis monooxygenase n=1 Tax=Streptomyces TaxID=1883 RepID=UPI00036B449D|nr:MULTISPECIES: hypothetical protein [Streptomyces]MCY0984194.1 hypothetical protein [Streptomyces tirandamycinicus]NNJ05855.1 YdhR family protein [Streptomyces sp. PKU-MA01144]